MPYELIRLTYGNNSACKLQFFGIEDNYMGVLWKYLKNIPGIYNKKPLMSTVFKSMNINGFLLSQLVENI